MSTVRCRALYESARSLSKAQQYAAALANYESAYAAAPSASWLLVSIGRVQQKLGKTKEAAASYKRYLDSPAEQLEPKLAATAREYLKQAEQDSSRPRLFVPQRRDKLTTVVLEPRVNGSIGPEDLEVLEKAVQTALQEQQSQIISSAERDGLFATNVGLKNCYRNDCLEQIGSLLGAHLVLAYQITTTGLSSVEIVAVLYNVEDGAIGSRVDFKCTRCSGPQVMAQTADLVKRAVLENGAKPHEVLEITSEPSNSSVLVDGIELGVTPYRRPTFIGRHEITVRHTGHRSVNQEITVVANQKNALTIQLAAG